MSDIMKCCKIKKKKTFTQKQTTQTKKSEQNEQELLPTLPGSPTAV